MKEIILASQSPRRRELLGRFLDEFTVLSDNSEEKKLPGEAPEAMVQRLAMDKVLHIAAQVQREALIIGADTVVVLDGQVLGKPADEKEAECMLNKLSGREHTVMTGIAVMDAQVGVKAKAVERTQVCFRTLSSEDIQQYIASGEPMDKAGAYGIQELGALFVEGIKGDYFNVVGLPLCRLDRLLKEEFSFELIKAR